MEKRGRYEAQDTPQTRAPAATTTPSTMSARVRLRRERKGEARFECVGGSGRRRCWPARFLRRSMTRGDDIFPHVRPERLRNSNRAVRTLVVLDYLAEDAGCGKRGVVEGVNVSKYPIIAAVADAEPSRLEIMEIRRGVRLAGGLLARHPRLDVVLLHLPQAQIAAAIDDDVVGKLQFLQKLLGVLCEFFVPLHRLLMARFAEDPLLVLLEFMDAENTLRIFAVTPRLASETRRELEEFDGQIFFLKYLLGVVAHRRDFRGAREVVAVLRLVEVVLALRQIAGADERLAAHHRRHYHRCEAFVGETVLHEPLKRPHHSCAVVLEKISAEARDFGAALVIGRVVRKQKLAVILGLEIELWKSSTLDYARVRPPPHFFIVGIRIPFRYRDIRDVGHLDHQHPPLLEHFLHRLFGELHGFFHALHARDKSRALLRRGFCDGIGCDILLRALFIDGGLPFFSLVVEREELVEVEVDVLLF